MDEDRRILVNEGDDDDIDELEFEFQGGGKERAVSEENCLNIVYLSSIVAAIGTGLPIPKFILLKYFWIK